MKRSSTWLWQWCAATVAWGCTLLFLSLTSAPPSLPGPLGWDKLDHAAALGVMAYLAARTRNGCCRLRQALDGFFVGTGFGVAIEILQDRLTANRQADLYDVLADMLGAAIASLIFYLQQRRTE